MRRKITDGRTRLIPPLVSAIIFISILAAAASGTAFLFENWASIAGEAADREGTLQCTPPPPQMTSWWTGDDTGDDLLGNNNGILMNGVGFADGMVGRAFSFTNSSHRVQVNNSASLQPVSAISFDAWIKPASLSNTFNAVLAKSDETIGQRSYGMWVMWDGRIIVIPSTFTGMSARTGPGTVPIGQWTHVAAIITHGVGYKIFVNGVEQAITIEGPPPVLAATDTPFTIGTSDPSWPNHNFQGLIDEVEFFQRELTATEVFSIYAAGNAGKCKPATILGDYADTSVALSGNAVVTPDTSPTGITRITASAPTTFRGQLAVDNSTGAVRVTNAHPAGVYPITVTAFGPGGTATKTFQLTVSSGQACNTIGFQPAGQFPLGASPTAAALGDFNNDGHQDVAMTASPNLLLVWSGSGTGTFPGSAAFPVGSNPMALAAGDLNGDGHTDIVTANLNSHTVSVVMNNGSGSFSSAVHYPVENAPRSVAIADLNNDGLLDIAAANVDSNSVSILLGNGTGTFPAAVNFPTGANPISIAIGDLNGDGNKDIASANFAGNSVSVVLGNGLGGFGSPSTYGGLSNPHFIIVADLNNDGNQDVATPNVAADQVSVMLGNGTGILAPPTHYAVGSVPVTIATGDFDRDGSPELVTADHLAGQVSILKGDGLGGFGAAVPVAVGTVPYGLAVGDLNGDGVQDIVSANASSNDLSLLLGVCALPSPTPTPNRGSIQFSSAIYNGDEGTNAVITFTRTGGSDGAVSAAWTYTGGTAIRGGTCGLGGTDFIVEASGTVSWADQDSADKTLSIHLCEDPLDSEGPETAIFELSEPTGGATLGMLSTTTLTINDIAVPTPTPTPTPTCVTAPSGIVSWWRADDNAWDVMNLNNGVLQNGAVFSPGNVGKAFELDGIDDFVQARPTSGLPVGAAPRTVEFWFRTPLNLSVNTESALFQYGTPSVSQMFGLITSGNASGRLYFYGHADDLAGTTVLEPDTWYHTAVTYDGATVRLYLNGSLDASGAKTLNTVLDTNGITIGSRPGSSKWKGQIDEPTLYNRALSAAEVVAIYQAGSLGKCGTCAPVPVGMTALWTGDQHSRDIRGGHDAGLFGGAEFTVGKYGIGALEFPGSGAYAEVTDGFFDPGSLPFTNDFWFFSYNTPPADAYLIGKSHPDGGLGWDIRYADGRIKVSGINGWDFNIITDQVAPVNMWHHVALSATATEAKLYINGILRGTSPRSPVSSTANPMRFGFTTNYGGSSFQGKLDEISFYDRALTESEIVAIAAGNGLGWCKPTAATPPSGIVRWWAGDGDLKNFSPIFAPLNDVNGVGFFLGKVGQGFRFRRADQAYFWATDNGMPFGDASRTVEFWAKPANNARMPFLYGGFSTAGAFYPMFINNKACIGNWGGGDVCGTINIADGNWHHIALTYSQAAHVAYIYVDGEYDASMSRVYNSVPASGVFLGSSTPAGSNEFYEGDLDEVTVYDRQLTQAEIQRIVRAGFAGKLKQVPAPAAGGFAERTDGNGYIYVGDAAVSFPTVTTAGQLHEIPIALNGLPPLPYLSMGLTYDIATGAEYTGQPTVCFNLPAFTPPEYNGMRILHLENGQWVDRTVLSNTYPVRCAAGMTSLSPFAIAYLTPTAAGVSVSGRILDGTGRGIINARLTLTDTAGTVRSAVSNSFGYYRFEGVPVGEAYVIEAKHRRFRFMPQAVNVSDNINELDLIGIE